jgi:hypothetical protein
MVVVAGGEGQRERVAEWESGKVAEWQWEKDAVMGRKDR